MFDEFPLVDMNADGTLKDKDLYYTKSVFTPANSYTGTPDGYTNYAYVYRVRSDRIERLYNSAFQSTAGDLSEASVAGSEGDGNHKVIMWDSATKSFTGQFRQGTAVPEIQAGRWVGHVMNYSSSYTYLDYDSGHSPCLILNGVQ
jgi:hypothetical protein